MKLQSGTWIGTLLTVGNRAIQVTVTLQVSDNGSVSGKLSAAGGLHDQTGPADRAFSKGSYSASGNVHLEYGSNDLDRGSFDGRFESPDGKTGVLWATAVFHRNGRVGTGTLVLIHADSGEHVADRGVWGDG